MKKILILEDDLVTQKIILHALQDEYDVITCSNMQEATEKIKNSDEISLFVLDRNLPDGDGLDICKEIRNRESNQKIPIIFLSGLISESDKVISLYAGGDDYMTKPFSILEFKARVAAKLRNSSRKIYTVDYEIDLDSCNVKNRNNVSKKISLTPIEFKLLVFFIQNKDRVFNRTLLLNKVWGDRLNVTDRVIDTHISHLRKKLSPSKLQFESYRGEGYKVTEDAA
jgi:DNA-binding response OmpR family regulator